jgi:hypothetical protein
MFHFIKHEGDIRIQPLEEEHTHTHTNAHTSTRTHTRRATICLCWWVIYHYFCLCWCLFERVAKQLYSVVKSVYLNIHDWSLHVISLWSWNKIDIKSDMHITIMCLQQMLCQLFEFSILSCHNFLCTKLVCA